MRRSSTVRVGPILLLAMGIPLSHGHAQECNGDESLDDCWNRLYAQGTASHDRTVKQEALLRLYGKTVGSGSGVGGFLGSAIEDFLPLFAGAVAVDRESPDNEVLMGFDLNLGLHHRPGSIVQPPNVGGTLRLRGEFRESGVFQPVMDSVPPALREAIRDSVGRGLDDLDDLSLELAWNRESTTMGRSVRPHAREIDALFSSIIARVNVSSKPSPTEFIAVWQDSIRRSIDAAGTKGQAGCDYDGADLTLMRCLEPDVRAALELATATDAGERREYMAAVDQALETAGFDRLVDLLNNQPQLSLSANARLRGDVVGPDDYSIRIRYETSRANFNKLREHCNGNIDRDCFRVYVHDPEVSALLRDSDRFWVSGELHVIDDFVFDRSFLGEDIRVALDGSLSARGEIGYGQYLQVDDRGNELARLDLFIAGELHESGSGRQDHWDATITYTQRVSDAFSIPISLSYSNKHEILPAVEDFVRLNLGGQYRLHRDPP